MCIDLKNEQMSFRTKNSRYVRKEVMDLNGTIKTLIRGRGYGFISAEDGREIFFHQTDLVDVEFDSLEEEQQVQFDVEKGTKGPKAVNVKLSTE
jgi:CspA family cold shock protein